MEHICHAAPAADTAPRLPTAPGPATRTGAHAARAGGLTAGSVVIIEDIDALHAHVNDIEALAARAVEPNPFYEPWMLLPALANLAASRRIAFVLIYSDARAHDRRLLGFFPLERLRSYRGFIVTGARMLSHSHCFLCTPLVDREATPECLRELMAWIGRARVAVLECTCLSSAGAVRQWLTRLASGSGVHVDSFDRYERAALRPGTDAESYLRSTLNSKHRKEYRRQFARLAELGRLEYRTIAPGHEAAWIQSFLELEQAGWKGRNGSAFASSSEGRRFFESMMRGAAERGRLAGFGLFLDDRPIALSVKLRSGDAAFAFKIAFDESYARFSPGALLELKAIEWLHQTPGVRWMDSCAAAEHFMANRLWAERCPIETLVITSGIPGAMVRAWLRMSRALARARRRLARRLLSADSRAQLRGWLS